MRPLHAHLALGSLVVGAPHLLGGVFAWGTLTLAIGACLVLGLALGATRPAAARTGRPEPMLALFAVMLAVTTAHALPLPAALAARIAPEALLHARQAALGLGIAAPEYVAFSLDPGGTHERILYGVAMLAAFCAARLLAQGPQRTAVLAAVAVSAIGVAASDVLHQALGASQVYGLYTPEQAAARGPLLNPNNLAGFLALGLPVCLGLAAQSAAGPRWAWGVGAAVVTATNLLTGSRGGTVALVSGAVLFGALHFMRGAGMVPGTDGRRSRHQGPSAASSRQALGVSAVVVLCLAIGGVLASVAADSFVDTDYQDLSKFDIYRVELALLLRDAHTTWLGVGRGGFSVAFAQISPWLGRSRAAESLPLQYAIEFGLPVAVLLLGGVALRVGEALWRWRSPAQLGGVVGVVTIALQNLLDFSLELSGIALPAAVCLAAALPSRRGASRPAARAVGLWRHSAWGLGVCSGLVVAFGPSAVGKDSRVAERALRRDLADHNGDAFWTRFNSVAMAHPADPAFALLAAAQRVTEGGDAAFWLQRASDLAPASALPHLWAARAAERKGKWDAALEAMRRAATLDPGRMAGRICPWVAAAPTASTVLRIAPAQGEARIGLLDAGADCLAGSPSEASKVDALLLGRRPNHLRARLRTAQRELAAQHWDAAIQHAREVQKLAPTRTDAYVVEANALVAQGKPKEAVERVLTALPRADRRGALLTALASAQTHAGDAVAMRQTIDQLRMAGAGKTDELAQAAALLAGLEGFLGNEARALRAIREAYSLQPAPHFLADAARLAAGLGQSDFALDAWEKLCAHDPANQSYCAARDALRTQRQEP